MAGSMASKPMHQTIPHGTICGTTKCFWFLQVRKRSTQQWYSMIQWFNVILLKLVARIRNLALSMWTGVVLAPITHRAHILFSWTNVCIHTCKISILSTIRCHIEEFLVHPGRCAVGCLRVWDILRSAWYPHWHGLIRGTAEWHR